MIFHYVHCHRWKGYSGPEATGIVSNANIRDPIPKRFVPSSCFKSQDWPTLANPQYLQEFDKVKLRRPDGTLGEILTVTENDPFQGMLKVNHPLALSLKYYSSTLHAFMQLKFAGRYGRRAVEYA